MSIEFSTITIICFVSQPNRNDIMYMRYVREERLVCYFRSPLLHSYYRTLQRVVNYQVQRRKWSTSVKFRRRLLGTNNFRCDINIYIYIRTDFAWVAGGLFSNFLLSHKSYGNSQSKILRVIYPLLKWYCLNMTFPFLKINVMMMTRKITVVRFQ